MGVNRGSYLYSVEVSVDGKSAIREIAADTYDVNPDVVTFFIEFGTVKEPVATYRTATITEILRIEEDEDGDGDGDGGGPDTGGPNL